MDNILINTYDPLLALVRRVYLHSSILLIHIRMMLVQENFVNQSRVYAETFFGSGIVNGQKGDDITTSCT